MKKKTTIYVNKEKCQEMLEALAQVDWDSVPKLSRCVCGKNIFDDSHVGPDGELCQDCGYEYQYMVPDTYPYQTRAQVNAEIKAHKEALREQKRLEDDQYRKEQVSSCFPFYHL